MCCVHERFTLSPQAGSTEEVEQKVGEAGPKPTIFTNFTTHHTKYEHFSHSNRYPRGHHYKPFNRTNFLMKKNFVRGLHDQGWLRHPRSPGASFTEWRWYNFVNMKHAVSRASCHFIHLKRLYRVVIEWFIEKKQRISRFSAKLHFYQLRSFLDWPANDFNDSTTNLRLKSECAAFTNVLH